MTAASGISRRKGAPDAARPDLPQTHRLLCSPLIDPAIYADALGASQADLGTVVRYLRLPVDARPPLTPYFDAVFFRSQHPDLPTQADPLLAFLVAGLAAWWDPHPLIDLRHIARQDPTLLGETPTAEALVEVLAYDLADPSPYFDRAFYASEREPPIRGMLRHFLEHGLAAGLRPNRWLDIGWYAEAYPDVPDDPADALRHFVLTGDPEARQAGPFFDGTLYRRRYTDVADAGAPPLWHFLVHGRTEGRQPASDRLRVGAAVGSASAPARPGDAVPVSPAAARDTYAALARRLGDLRQEAKDSVRLAAPSVIVSDDPLRDLRRIKLPRPAAPRLSILIPAYNEAAHTVAALLALAAKPPGSRFEVIVADDGSTEPAYAALDAVRHLTVVRTGGNLGFLRACNAAWRHCRGEYVLLLNNDAQPLGDAVDRLSAALDADPAIAAAGAKLIYPNGRLQEAGCFLRPDGTSGMVGLFADRDAPDYAYDRDVAYCSAAALMLRRAAVGETLFDEAYAPAYCEDADLCLRLAQAGHRIRYVSGAVFVHYLSVSTGQAGADRRHRTIARNQQRLQERWGERLAAIDQLRAIAFYLPQFHPIPENDLWWGAGFTEWTNVARATPSYVGHYQPHLPADLGFYDLRQPDTLRRQAMLARRYGLAGFCVYHYDFGERRLLDTPMAVLHANPDIPFAHCLCWANENWTRNWDGGGREVLIEQRYDGPTLSRIAEDAVRHARDPRYLTVDGRPIFLVYRPMQLPDAAAFAARLRAAFRAASFPDAYLIYVESMEAAEASLTPASIGFDAAVEFPPHGRAVPADDAATIVKEGWSGYRYSYQETVLSFIARGGSPYCRHPAVFPSWDNTPRQPDRGTSFDGASPDAFRFYVEQKIEAMRGFLMGEQRLLFVNAWNEWAEGAHLEPDTGYGHRWLEALRDALGAKAWE